MDRKHVWDEELRGQKSKGGSETLIREGPKIFVTKKEVCPLY